MAKNNKKKMDKTDNPREYKMLKRVKDLSCSFCKPHKNENSSRKSKHGHTKKNKRIK